MKRLDYYWYIRNLLSRVSRLCGRGWAAPSSFMASRSELRASSASSHRYHGNPCPRSLRCCLCRAAAGLPSVFCLQGASSPLVLETADWTSASERVSSLPLMEPVSSSSARLSINSTALIRHFLPAVFNVKSVSVFLAGRLTAVVALPFYCASLIETVQVTMSYDY